MIETRRLALDVRYNSYPFAGQVGGDIESLTYTDSAADNSDSIDITINAQDRKWLLGWMPEKIRFFSSMICPSFYSIVGLIIPQTGRIRNQ